MQRPTPRLGIVLAIGLLLLLALALLTGCWFDAKAPGLELHGEILANRPDVRFDPNRPDPRSAERAKISRCACIEALDARNRVP